MHWVVPSEKDTAAGTLEKRLWDTADQQARDLEATIAKNVAEVLEA
jgi:hypothetical protein